MRNASNFNNLRALKDLFFSYSKLIIEFVPSIWSSFYDVDIDRIERVQNKVRFAARQTGTYIMTFFTWLLQS